MEVTNILDSNIAAMQEVIRKLRVDNLNHGHCFMIFDDELPGDQAYYEYPDGSFQIEQLDGLNFDNPRIIIKELTEEEIAALKEKHEVYHQA